MARHPSPWYWEARDGWYATVGGVRHRLADGKPAKRAALKRLGELLAGQGRGDAPAEVLPVVGLVTLYLEDLRRRKESKDVAEQAKADAVRRMAGFVEMHGDLPADQLRPHHVQAWLDTRTTWGATSRHDGVGAVRSVFRWAKAQGHLERDPLDGMKKPQRKPKREAIPEPGDVERAFAAIVTPELADLLTFVYETGCRPKEARTLEARHLDIGRGIAVQADHKTAKKTRKKRVIYLTGRAAEIAARLAAAHPEGAIFRNSRGNAWTHNAVGLAVRRIRERTGLGPEMVAYAFRHGFATDALARGVSPAFVAEMMGHADLRMLATYSHLSEQHEALREAVEKVRGGGSGGAGE